MTPVAEFNKCPVLDSELKAWSNMNSGLIDVFFGEHRDYRRFVYTVSNLKNVDENNKIVEYGFTDVQLKTIAECYKEESWDIENITDDIIKAREEADLEKSYINNIVREWKDYEVPAVEKGYYTIRNAGLFRICETIDEETHEKKYFTKDVCRTPFVICGVSEPLKGDQIYFKIRYSTYTGDVREFWASQSTLLSRKELKTVFLSKGINCPENILLVETIDYISRCIAEFGPRLKKEYSAKQTGWSEDKSIFVLGDRAISLDGIKPILSVGNNKGFPELEKKGTLEGWIEGTKEILNFELIRFKCYDAMSAPLKSILGVESHATDHYGNTSCGKTFSAQIPLSMIGDAEGLTIGAKSTAKGILVHIRDFSDLPVLIDESSDAGEHLADLVYPLTSNKGRVKSTVDGQRDGGEEFHTSTMFTGEKPIRDCLQNSGQQYRVNELDDTLPDLSTKEINAVKRAIRDNHGHIIELYLQKVLEWASTGKLQKRYETCFDNLPENNSNIEGRSKSIFACIMLAGYILEQVFIEIGMPQKDSNPIVNKYYKKCIQDKPVELEYIRALRVIMDWINSDYKGFARFNTQYDDIVTIEKNKIYGFVDDTFIDVIGTEFSAKMKKEGFSPTKIREDWFKQGITISNDSKRPGTYRSSRKGYGPYAGVRITKSIAGDLVGYNEVDTKANKEEETIFSQYEKINLIFDTIKLLTRIHNKAELFRMRAILTFPELDELLTILSTTGKIFKVNQTEYKIVK